MTKRKISFLAYTVVVIILFTTLNTLGYTQGSVDSDSVTYGNNCAEIGGGSYGYHAYGGVGYWIELSLEVDFQVEDGYYIQILIDQQDNLYYDWEKVGSSSIHSYGFSYTTSSCDSMTKFWHRNSYDYVEEAGTIEYKKFLYGGPSTNHFKIYLKIFTEGDSLCASVLVDDIYNTRITYEDLGGLW